MSTLRVTTLQNLSGVEVYTAKAWVNFNGTGTVAIRAQGNVSSITDNGASDYTVNFTNAMTDANYTVLCGGTSANGRFPHVKETAAADTTAVLMTTTQVRVWHQLAYADTAQDLAQFHVAIFR
jgi:hypothetical protein